MYKGYPTPIVKGYNSPYTLINSAPPPPVVGWGAFPTIDTVGGAEFLTVHLSRATTGNNGFSLIGSAGTITLTYVSGDGTADRVYSLSRRVQSNETFNAVGQGLTYSSGNIAGFLGGSSIVTNNSTYTIPFISAVTVNAAGTQIAYTWNRAVVTGTPPAGYSSDASSMVWNNTTGAVVTLDCGPVYSDDVLTAACTGGVPFGTFGDPDGVGATAFSGFSVTNNSTVVRPLSVTAVTASPNPRATGGTVTLTVTWVGGTGPFDVAFDDGNGGTHTATGVTSPATWVTPAYGTSGTFTPSAVVTDSLAATASGGTSLLVADPPSGVTVTPPAATYAGVLADFSIAWSGGLASYHTFLDGGDGGGYDTDIPVGSSPLSHGHTFAVTSPYTVTGKVVDSAGGQATGTAGVTVYDPVSVTGVSASPNPAVSTVDAVGVSATTAGGAAALTVDVDWGDGSAHGTSLSDTHTYSTPGDYTITVTASDGFGLTGSSASAQAGVTVT
jgi:hypothetical protein